MIFIIITILLLISLFYRKKWYDEYVNYTNYDYHIFPKLKFDTILEILNKYTKKFENKTLTKHLRFIPGTFNNNIIKKISCLLTPIIKKINDMTRENFIVTEYKEILLSLDKSNTIYVFIDFFIYNKKNFGPKKRLLTNIVVNNSGFKYLNHIRLYNNGKITNGIVDNTSLESMFIRNYQDLKIDHYKKRNKTILPDDLNRIDSFPCNNIINIWNNNGLKWSEKNIIPYFNPTVTGLPRDNEGLLGMFDLAVGIPSFPTSHSI